MAESLQHIVMYAKFYGAALAITWVLVCLFWVGVWLLGGGRR